MKKKLLTPILSLVCLLACTICFACSGGGKDNDGESNDHLHIYENYVYNNDATYGKSGTETAKCIYCNATDT